MKGAADPVDAQLSEDWQSFKREWEALPPNIRTTIIACANEAAENKSGVISAWLAVGFNLAINTIGQAARKAARQEQDS